MSLSFNFMLKFVNGLVMVY